MLQNFLKCVLYEHKHVLPEDKDKLLINYEAIGQLHLIQHQVSVKILKVLLTVVLNCAPCF